MKSKILILGGTKFVGRQLVEKLIEEEFYEIFLFNRGATNPDLFAGITKIIGDRETDDIEKIKNYKWDYVIDFSSYFPSSLEKTILNLNRDLKKYIYISSVSAYSLADYDSSFEIEESFKLKPYIADEILDTSLKTYGKRKAACEATLHKYEWLNKIILRPSLIYGKYDWTDRFYYWLYKVKNEQKTILPDSGKHKLSLTFADDFTRIITEILKSDLMNGIFNCSTHKPLELKKMLEYMSIECGTNLANFKKDIPQDWLMANKINMQSDIPIWYGGNVMISNERVQKTLNFEFTSFEKSIKKTIEFYKQLGWKKPSVGWDEKNELEIIRKYDSTSFDT